MSDKAFKDDSKQTPERAIPPIAPSKSKKAKANGADTAPLPATDPPPEDDDANDSAPEVIPPASPKRRSSFRG